MRAWLSLRDLAVYLRYCEPDDSRPRTNSARMWAQRNGLVPVHRGRAPLYDARDVEAALRASKPHCGAAAG